MKYRKNVLIIDKFYDDPDSVVKNIIDNKKLKTFRKDIRRAFKK